MDHLADDCGPSHACPESRSKLEKGNDRIEASEPTGLCINSTGKTACFPNQNKGHLQGKFVQANASIDCEPR